jgi:hypothetical protein
VVGVWAMVALRLAGRAAGLAWLGVRHPVLLCFFEAGCGVWGAWCNLQRDWCNMEAAGKGNKAKGNTASGRWRLLVNHQPPLGWVAHGCKAWRRELAMSGRGVRLMGMQGGGGNAKGPQCKHRCGCRRRESGRDQGLHTLLLAARPPLRVSARP